MLKIVHSITNSRNSRLHFEKKSDNCIRPMTSICIIYILRNNSSKNTQNKSKGELYKNTFTHYYS